MDGWRVIEPGVLSGNFRHNYLEPGSRHTDKSSTFLYILLCVMSNYGQQVDLEPVERIRTSEGLGGSTPKKTPSPQEWAHQRQTIVFLFITRDLTLSEVKQQMDKLGFFAT